MHEIDLAKYDLRTDLIIEKINKDVNVREYNENGIKVSEVVLEKENVLNKKAGSYITISFNDVTDSTNFNNVLRVLVKEIKKMLKKENISDNDTCLVVGLGNI